MENSPTALAIQQWVTLLRSVILSSRRVRLEAFHTWAGFARDAAVPKLSELMKKKARETETSDMPVGPPPVGGQVSRFGDEFERVCSQAQSAGKLQDPPSQSTPFPTSCKRQKTTDVWTEGVWAERHHHHALPLLGVRDSPYRAGALVKMRSDF